MKYYYNGKDSFCITTNFELEKQSKNWQEITEKEFNDLNNSKEEKEEK